jgi:hypothetical protein
LSESKEKREKRKQVHGESERYRALRRNRRKLRTKANLKNKSN